MSKDELIEYLCKCQNELVLYALKLTGKMHDAEELVSELCINILERSDTAEEVRFPKPFFKACLRNLAYNSRIEKNRFIVIDPTDSSLHQIMSVNSCDIATVEFLLSLNKRLAKYPPDLVEAFCMRYLDGYPLHEIADKMGIPANTLSQKFKRLRQSLSESGSNFWLMVIMFHCNF